MTEPLTGRAAVMLENARRAWERGEFFFHVRIPENLQPAERGLRYEDPLDDALGHACVGRIAGGGSQLAKDGSIEYCGVDIVVTERRRGLAIIRETLQAAGASEFTVIEEYLPVYREHALQPNRD